MRHTHRKLLPALLALVLAVSLMPTPAVFAAESTMVLPPKAVEWESGTVKVKRQGLGPSLRGRATDPLGRSGILQEPGSSCFQNWTYNRTDLNWLLDSQKLGPEAWSTRLVTEQNQMTFL